MTIRQDVDALTAKDFTRRGHWYVSPQYGIELVACFHGVNHCLYRWDFPGDVGRELVGVKQSLDEAVKLIGEKS